MAKLFKHFGRYLIMLCSVFSRPKNLKMFWREFMHQCVEIGIRSIDLQNYAINTLARKQVFITLLQIT